MELYFQWLIIHLGYIGIFLALALGIIGLPIPDEVLLTFVGYQIFQNKFFYLPSFLCAFIGAMTGISLSYWIGKKLGLPFLHKYGPKFRLTKEKIEYVQKMQGKYGQYLLIFGYFLPGVRHLVAYLAGITNYRFRKFMLFAYVGAFIWTNTFIFLGILLGKQWVRIVSYIHQIGIVFVLIFVVFIPIVVMIIKNGLALWKDG